MTHPDTCPECGGEPLPPDEFHRRSGAIAEALGGIDHRDAGALLAMFVGAWLADWDAGDERQRARQLIINSIDRQTKQLAILASDA